MVCLKQIVLKNYESLDLGFLIGAGFSQHVAVVIVTQAAD